MIGEATHGTHEFYRERALITRRLIEEKGFSGGRGRGGLAGRLSRQPLCARRECRQRCRRSLADFERFPTWMWRNADVLEFIGWLRAHNDAHPADRRVGFYGLDLYSMRASIQAVLAYLSKIDPEAAQRARRSLWLLRPVWRRAASSTAMPPL